MNETTNTPGKATASGGSAAVPIKKRLHRAKVPANLIAIPEKLRAMRRWVVWDYIDYGDSKPRKVPVAPGKNHGLSWNVSTAWRTFDEVIREAQQRGGLGIGFVFDEGDGINAVDLDDAYGDDGNLKPWAQEIASRYGHTYCERTPSGRGVHFIGYGDRVLGDKNHDMVPEVGAIERYSQDRWFTFTGDVIHDRPVNDVCEAMAWLAETYFGGATDVGNILMVATPSDDPEFDTELARVCVEHLSDQRASGAEDWRRVGYALKATSETLLPVWLEFSRRWPGCSDQECHDRWQRFRSKSTVGTLVQMAGEDSGRSSIELRDDARERLGRPAWQPASCVAAQLPTMKATAAVVASAIDEEPHSGAADLARPHTLTDVGLGRRLAKRIRGRLTYVRERDSWSHWDGTRWAEKAEHIAQHHAKRMHDDLWDDLASLSHAERTPAVVKFVQDSGTRARITAAMWAAQSESGINTSQSDYDTHTWLLNVRNGVIDLRSGELVPHDPRLRITQLAAVEYQPDAHSELWDRFIRDVTCGDDEIAEFLQQAFGLALTGDVTDEVLVCHNGAGCNGKSSALEAVGKMLGDYAAVAPPGLFTARKFDSHPTEIAGLRGKRFVTAIEQEGNRALRESLIKQMTGGDTIRTRGMREDFWEMLPTWHIHIAYNTAPRLTGTDDGIRRRLRVVPWNASFQGSPDLTVKERLTSEAERAGILNWCMEGLRKRLASGRLYSPEAVMIATGEYIDDEDLIGRFIAERTEAEPGHMVEVREMLRAFREWMQADGSPRHVVEGFTANALGRELARRGYRKMRPDSGLHRKQTVVAGLRLANTHDDLPGYHNEAWAAFSE